MSSEQRYFEQLGERVGQTIGEGPDAQRRARQKQALLDDLPAAAPRRSRLWPRVAMAAAAAGLVVGATLWLSSSSRSIEYWIGGARKTRPVQGLVSARQNQSVPIYFSDGSQVELRGASTAQVVEASAEQVRIALRHGTLEARVRSRPQTRYLVVAGPFRIEDIGTVFKVRWDPVHTRLAVTVQEGVVKVEGGALAGGGIRMEAGARLDVAGEKVQLTWPAAKTPRRPAPSDLGGEAQPAVDRRIAAPPAGRRQVAAPPAGRRDGGDGPKGRRAATPPAMDQRGDTPTVDPRVASPRPPRGVSTARTPRMGRRSPTWQRAYGEGDYRTVMKRARVVGLATLARGASSDDLWRLASAARYTRDGAAARLFLLAIRKRFKGTPRARTAAYLLGLVAVELSNNAAGAIRWFETYLREDRKGPLSEEAHGRLIIACQRVGRLDTARAWARRYLARYGAGLYGKTAQAVLRKGP